MTIRRLPAFSLIEVVLGLLILSMLVSISVSMFEGQTEKVKEDAAREQLQVIQNALTRWQLENNRAYPYRDLNAVEKKYLDNVSLDPWGNEYKVIPEQGIVYTFGPDRVDNQGGGDDFKTSYAVRQVAQPQPPARLAARPQGTSVELRWNPPTRNVDGTPLATGTGTWVYEVFVSEGQASYPATPQVTVPFNQTTWSASGLKPKTNYYYKTRVVRTLAGTDALKSDFSNQAGTFVPGSTLPEIRRFTASSQKVPINSPFSIDVDVIDPTSNLQEAKVRFNGNTTDLLAGGGNNFHVLRTFIPSSVPRNNATVKDGLLSIRGGVPVTAVVKTLPFVDFVNSRPVLTSLRPGVVSFTAQPSKKATVEFTVEARDDDKNLTKIVISDPAGHSASFDEPKVQFAVERVSWEYDLSTTHTFFVTCTATDELGEVSLPANAQVAIAADITPPETPVVNLNPSNDCIATDDKVFAWSIRESKRVTIHADSFDPESPPVSFKVLISTRPPSPLTSFESNAVTQDKVTKVKGWTSPITTNQFTLEYKDGGAGDLQNVLEEGKFYYVGVRAQNNSVPPLQNKTVVQPKNPKTGYPQNPFIVDFTPPRVTFVGIDNPGRGFVCGGATLTGRWRAEDLIKDGSKDGSGPYRYRYQVFERLATGPTTGTSGLGSLIYDNESETTELRFALPSLGGATPNKYHMARYTLAVKVRDTSCQWSVSTSTATVIEDQTPPQLTFLSPPPQGQPVIFAPAGTLNDPNTIEGAWANVLIDPDEAPYILGTDGIKSYEWGVARRCEVNLPFPDIFPGDGSWRFAGTSISDRAVRQNMLTNGDFVNIVVRAYNWAGCASSIVTCSKALLVDTSLQVNLKASQNLLYVCPQPQNVSFVGTVTGGGPSFNFKDLQPRSDPTDPDNRLSVGRTPARTVTYDAPPVTYTFKDIGRKTATLEVESFTSDTAPAPNLARRADAPIICRCQPYVVALNQGDLVSPAGVSILDMARTTSPAVATLNLPAGEKPTDLVIDPARYSNDSTKVGARWALLTSNTLTTGRVYRLALEGDAGGGLRLEETFASSGESFAAIDVSRDGTIAFVTVNAPDPLDVTRKVRKYYRLSLDNGRNVGVLPVPANQGVPGTGAGVHLSASGAFGVGVLSETKEVEKIESPQSSTTLNRAVFALLNDGMTPDIVDFSSDDKLSAFSSSAAGSVKVGFLDLVRGERSGFEPTSSPGETYGVRFDPIQNARVYFTCSNQVVSYVLAGDTNRITGTKTLGPPLALAADAQLRGLDLPFDGSYLVAAASGLDRVLVLQADGHGGINPFQPGNNVFGAPLAIGPASPGFPVGRRPIDVQVAERLSFGQPIIRFLPLTSVSASAGTTLSIRGSNFTPAGVPFNAFTVTVGGVRAIFQGSDNLAEIRVVLDPSTPVGSQDVVVTNSTISALDLRDSLPVRINVTP